ncbi:XRE family transcriptional regulator [Streptomyces sp. JV180]|uniref:XRE family transcriptional regulator n=1 Tax=Streptomyces sp. JV180 TaxID=858634 RepID=UPI00168A7138|nr:XRE family transcriptional regulator [Streptomyces sp. JV180]MBD3546795.1 XRE family transcriptional regulator [Streptomyces sp. JV180]
MADEVAARTDFADLVRRRMEELRLSFRVLTDRAVDPDAPDAGPQWAKGTLVNLVSGRAIKAPGPAQLRALAAALEVPLRALQDAAAAQWFGMETVTAHEGEGDLETRLLVRRYQAMSPEDRRRLQIIAETYDPS